MASQLDANIKDDLKTQFVTREGTYRLLQFSEYSRPNRVGYSSNQSSPQVRVSIVSLPNPVNGSSGNGTNNGLEENSSGNNSSNNKSQNQQISGNIGNNNSNSRDLTDCNRLNGSSSIYTSGIHNTVDGRIGAGISMHSMMNGCVGTEQSCYASQILGGDRICFNFGRELYVYAFRGIKKGSEMSKPIDKKFYKGTNPSCHDFNSTTATAVGAPLLVGFTTGQIQLVSPQPGPRELRKLYNEERLIDKTKVTCLKWLPNSSNLFLVSHASGHLYLYNEDLPCIATAPSYQPFKMGDGYTILTCKSKSTRNPLYKWAFNTENCCINEFCFSPCGSNLAIVSQDGFLRVFHYDTMELLGIARSYFGGFLCVCWSPDGKYIVVGGEDDLVTVWSFHERRVVARGQGHRSWVSVVAFDPYTTSYTNWDGGDFSDEENQLNEYHGTRDSRFSGDSSAGNGFDGFPCNDKASTPVHTRHHLHSASFRSDASSTNQFNNDKLAISYRLGSVSQDTQLCLWDITEDVLRHPLGLRQKVNINCMANDTNYMNGCVNSESVKIIRPIAIGNTSSSFPPPQHSSSPTKESNIPTEPNSNSDSSKFSTANCTISSHSSSANTPPDEALQQNKNQQTTNSVSKGIANSSGNTLKFGNCINIMKNDSSDSNQKSNSNSSGYSSKTTNSSSSKNSDTSGFSTLNSITQRLTSFSFLGSNNSDKKSFATSGNNIDGTSTQRNHRKTLSLLKSYNQHNTTTNTNANNINNTSTNTLEISQTKNGNNTSTSSHAFGSIKLGKSSTISHSNNTNGGNNSIVLSYDPMKLIGTPACPRFDECPLLEPLVCKKIAHERLTALIFREDCFLTACQDGVIYTWARPGFSSNSVTQHLSPNQMAPPGGTVI